MGRVFIPQAPKVRGTYQDIKDAERFGDLVIVFRPEDPAFRHEVYPDSVDDRLPNLMGRAKELMHDFNPATDYLALTGGSFFITLCIWSIAHLGNVRVLRYDRKEASYYPVMLP